MPEKLSECRKLKTLSLSNNLISNFNFICKIISLQNLDLDHNHILNIPDLIDNLENLEDLDLSYNRISIFSENLFKFKKLKALNLRSNNIKNIYLLNYLIF